jgi:hypothetical protein
VQPVDKDGFSHGVAAGGCEAENPLRKLGLRSAIEHLFCPNPGWRQAHSTTAYSTRIVILKSAKPWYIQAPAASDSLAGAWSLWRH